MLMADIRMGRMLIRMWGIMAGIRIMAGLSAACSLGWGIMAGTRRDILGGAGSPGIMRMGFMGIQGRVLLVAGLGAAGRRGAGCRLGPAGSTVAVWRRAAGLAAGLAAAGARRLAVGRAEAVI